jgi:predicted transposase YbfD/YdcC
MTATLLTILFVFAMIATTAGPAADTASRATRSATITLNGGVSKVFPLFGFIEEKKWSRGWDPKVLAMGDSLQDSVFAVTHDNITATWIVTEYDETQHRVAYAVFVPNDRAMTIRIACTGQNTGQDTDKDKQTRAEVTYTFTLLGEQGASAFHEFQQHDFALRILHWQHAINHYLETGKQWQGDSH